MNDKQEKAPRTPRTPKAPLNNEVKHESLSIIEQMIKEISETEDKVEIDGKKYTTVAKRNEILRKYLGFGVKIITDPLKVENDFVVFACTISVKQDNEWVEIATGHSEESRSSSEINKVAAFENAETSAIGRALANLGLTGGEFATVNEVKSKSGVEVSADVNLHIKSLIKASGLEEKSLFASYNIKTLDKARPDILIKIMNECLKSINQKKNKPKETGGTEESITL